MEDELNKILESYYTCLHCGNDESDAIFGIDNTDFGAIINKITKLYEPTTDDNTRKANLNIPVVRDLLIAFGNKFNKMLSDDQQFENIDFIVDEFQSNL